MIFLYVLFICMKQIQNGKDSSFSSIVDIVHLQYLCRRPHRHVNVRPTIVMQRKHGLDVMEIAAGRTSPTSQMFVFVHYQEIVHCHNGDEA